VFHNYDLGELAAYIDWGPFFQTWDLAGPFPAILEDKVVGEEAKRVYADAQAMLKKIVDGRWLTANGVIALYPANTVQDDHIEIYRDESRSEVLMSWCPLRMQTERPVVDGVKRPNRSLADFIAPREAKPDYIGMFAVTAGLNIEVWPGYVRPAAPGFLRGALAEGVKLPAAVTLRLPAASGGPAAVAYSVAADGNLLNLKHERAKAGDYITLKFEVPERFFHVEF